MPKATAGPQWDDFADEAAAGSNRRGRCAIDVLYEALGPAAGAVRSAVDNPNVSAGAIRRALLARHTPASAWSAPSVRVIQRHCAGECHCPIEGN